MVVLYVNNRSRERFADKIRLKLKQIETRTKRSAQNFMQSGIRKGDRFAVAADGHIVCYATFRGLKPYQTERAFNDDFLLHLVGKDSKYRFDPKRGKVGILLSDVAIEERSVKVHRTRGYTWTTC